MIAMKPRITGITLGADTLEKSLHFYRDGLGLPTEGIACTEFEHGLGSDRHIRLKKYHERDQLSLLLPVMTLSPSALLMTLCPHVNSAVLGAVNVTFDSCAMFLRSQREGDKVITGRSNDN